MRLVKQALLYFKEGNSDKVYEIDLCGVGNDQQVADFSMEKGQALHEGIERHCLLASGCE